MAPDRREDRVKRSDARPDPTGERGDIDFDTLARISLALPVQWLMQKELRSQDHGEQAWSGAPARDRMRGRRRLGDPFTVPARELFAHVLDDFPTARFAFE